MMVSAELQPSPALRLGAGSCPLVAGECVQGLLRGGRHFLITSPICLASRAEFTADLEAGEVVVEPAIYSKSLRAVRRFLDEEGIRGGGRLRVRTPLEPALGFGTSTADITASLRAVAAAWSRPLGPERIARIAADIEPTDGSMYAGSVAFAHREGVLLERLGSLPSFTALVVTDTGKVDTVEFDRRRLGFRYSSADEDELLRAWGMVRQAVSSQDLELLGEAGILSATINQKFHPHPMFPVLLRIARDRGAQGLLAAHSGSLLALLLDPRRPEYQRTREQLLRALEEVMPGPCLEVCSSTGTDSEAQDSGTVVELEHLCSRSLCG